VTVACGILSIAPFSYVALVFSLIEIYYLVHYQTQAGTFCNTGKTGGNLALCWFLAASNKVWQGWDPRVAGN
jgi:hypothetical protein